MSSIPTGATVIDPAFNCEELYKEGPDYWCRKCKAGYGVLVLIGLEGFTTTNGPSATYTYADNGRRCVDASLSTDLNKKKAINDCINYEMDASTG